VSFYRDPRQPADFHDDVPTWTPRSASEAAVCFMRFRSKDMLFLSGYVFDASSEVKFRKLGPVFDFGGGRFIGRADTFTPLTVTSRDAHRSRYSPAKPGWWARLFATLLFAFYVN
jgi:hypothetical protein